MNFAFNYDAATVNATTLGTNLASFKDMFEKAAAVFSGEFKDDITINLDVKYAPLGSGALAQASQTPIGGISYDGDTGIKKALEKDQTSIDDGTAFKSLPATDTHSYEVSRAQAKALHLLAKDDAGVDATITFTDAVTWDYSHSTSMAASSFDFFGVATHEISEAMGRVMFDGRASEFPLELFKSGRPFIGTTAGGFAVDGAAKTLDFNTGAGDFADWADTAPADDSFRNHTSSGQVTGVSATDLRVLDILGFDRKATDIAFVIDTTGSMTPYIDNVKANAIKITDAAFGTAADPTYARIAIVGFKDAAGPDGPGETQQVLPFTDQDTIDARKTAAVAAINSLTVGGGGDIPEADNSGLLVALKGELGDWHGSAQSHKIILFSDAPVKDVNLASQVEALSHDLGVSLVNASVSSSTGTTSGNFTFAVPANALGTSAEGDTVIGGDEAEVNPATPQGNPPPLIVGVQIFAIQVGSDSDATASLTRIASQNNGSFFTGDETNLADLILKIIDLPPSSGGNQIVDWAAVAAVVQKQFGETGLWFFLGDYPTIPGAATDWDTLAAVVTANFEATGGWFA